MVGAGVLAGDDDELGLVDVVEGHRALADADGLGERDRRRLVAHVGAVRQVVRAEGAGEELVGERRLVGGAPARVEDRLVGGGEPAQPLGDEGERVVPRDRLVVRAALAQHHRVRDAALLPEQVVGPAGSSATGCSAKNAGSTRRSVASSATALAPFSQNSAKLRSSGCGSGHAQPMQSKPSAWLIRRSVAKRAPGAHLLHAALRRDGDRGEPGRLRPDLAPVDLGRVDVVAWGRRRPHRHDRDHGASPSARSWV